MSDPISEACKSPVRRGRAQLGPGYGGGVRPTGDVPRDAERDYEPIQPRGTDWRGLLRKLAAPLVVLLGLAREARLAREVRRRLHRVRRLRADLGLEVRARRRRS